MKILSAKKCVRCSKTTYAVGRCQARSFFQVLSLQENFHAHWKAEVDGTKYNMLDVKQVHQMDSGDDYIDEEYKKRMERLAKLASIIKVF